jgi:hypothetical protein
MKLIKDIFVESNHIILPKRLSSEIYSEALSSLIIVCADAVIVSREKKSIFLAKRIVSPMKGYWTIGGRRFAGETSIDAVRRNFHRETGILSEESRFHFLTSIEVIWKDRFEFPNNKGKHDLIQFFSIYLNENEIIEANKNLLLSEYEAMSLVSFNLEELIKYQVNPIMHQIYNTIFP